MNGFGSFGTSGRGKELMCDFGDLQQGMQERRGPSVGE